MTMMTASDATAYCLAVAQLIPIFLIALYIIDYSWVTKNVQGRSQPSGEVPERENRGNLPVNTAEAAGLEKGYAKRAVLAIIVAIAGEIVVLGGAIGLISRLFAIAAGTGIVIYVIGILSEPAVDRLTWELNTALPKFLQDRLLPIAIGAALIAFIYIFVRVTITS
jgi:hypothetical protein